MTGFSLLIAHLVGDYLLQNDWQARNKKLRSWPCLVHCLLYSMSIWAFTFWPARAIGVVFVAHFIQDRTGIVRWWMHMNRQDGFADPPLGPWSIIVVDNTWHLLLLWLLGTIIA